MFVVRSLRWSCGLHTCTTVESLYRFTVYSSTKVLSTESVESETLAPAVSVFHNFSQEVQLSISVG